MEIAARGGRGVREKTVNARVNVLHYARRTLTAITRFRRWRSALARLRALMAMAIGAALTASCGAQFKPSAGGAAPQAMGKSAQDDGGSSGPSSSGGGGSHY